jgi:hypothetical protein
MKSLRKEIFTAIINILDESVYAQLRSPIHEIYGMQLSNQIKRIEQEDRE